MSRNNERPSQALFGSAFSSQPTNQIIRSAQSNFMILQHNLRSRDSISLLELESLIETIDRSGLSIDEITTLRDIAKLKAGESKRSQGWHCGFADLINPLEEILTVRDAA